MPASHPSDPSQEEIPDLIVRGGIVLTMVDGLVRFRDYNLYDAAALHSELLSAVRRMLRNPSCEGR